MHRARWFSIPIALVALAAAGCGGGGGSAKLSSSDIAVVGSVHVSLAKFELEMQQAKQSYSQSHQAFPRQGTPSYEAVKGQAVTILVRQAEHEDKANQLGIKISDKAIQARLDAIKKQYFGGSDKLYKKRLKQIHLTDANVRDDVRATLIDEALRDRITKNVTVSDSDVRAYYLTHIQNYTQPQSRKVRHIAVKSKALAQSIYTQLKAGNDKTWCTLAKKYSLDPSSKNACGRLTVTKGETVPVFDKVAFGGFPDRVHTPVFDAQKYKWWFVIEPLGIIHPRTTTPEKQAAPSIRNTLLTQKKTDAINAWLNDLSNQFCSGSKIKYQVGYQPNPDPCASSTTTT